MPLHADCYLNLSNLLKKMTTKKSTRSLALITLYHYLIPAIYGRLPECIMEPGTGNSDETYLVSTEYYGTCLRECLKKQLYDDDITGINGITFNFLNGEQESCLCHKNMVTIMASNASTERTCFLGPPQEDLSLTLMSRPDTLYVTPGSEFRFGFSVSYASVTNHKVGCGWKADYSEVDNRKSMQRKSALEVDEDTNARSNMVLNMGSREHTNNYEDYPTADGTAEYFTGYFSVYIKNQSSVVGNQIHTYMKLLMNDAAKQSTDELFTSFRVYLGELWVYIRHAFVRQHDPEDPTAVSRLEKDFPYRSFRPHEGTPPGHIHFAHFAIHIRNIGNVSITEHSITLRLPAEIEAEYVDIHNDHYSRFATAQCLHGKINTDGLKNTIQFYFPFTSPSIEECKLLLRWKVAENDLTLSRRNRSATYSVFVEQEYCPYKECNSQKMKVLEQRVWQFEWLEKSIFGDYKKFRVKNVYSGTCWSIDPETKKIVGTGSCTTHFYESSTFLYSDKSDLPMKYLYSEFGEDLSTENHYELYIYKKEQYLVHLRGHHDYCLAETNGTTRRIAFTNAGSVIYNKCNFHKMSSRSPVKLLTAFDHYDNINLRSLLVISLPSGAVNIVCNPGGDRGNRYNCFQQKQMHSSWKAFDSSITNINFYIPDTNTLYGKRDRGKSHFKLVDGVIIPISPIEYNTEMTNSLSVHAESFDNNIPVEEPEETISDANIGVSSKGLFRKSDGQWKIMLHWGY